VLAAAIVAIECALAGCRGAAGAFDEPGFTRAVLARTAISGDGCSADVRETCSVHRLNLELEPLDVAEAAERLPVFVRIGNDRYLNAVASKPCDRSTL
jgi:hypothetical protein